MYCVLCVLCVILCMQDVCRNGYEWNVYMYAQMHGVYPCQERYVQDPLYYFQQGKASVSYQPISNWYRRTLYCPDTVSSAGPSTTCMFQTIPGFVYMCSYMNCIVHVYHVFQQCIIPGFMYMRTAREPHCIAL